MLFRSRRDSRERGRLDRRMAITAVEAVIEHVVEVAELDGLLDELVRTGHVRRASEHHRDQDQSADQRQHAEQTELRKGIGASLEDLRHRMLIAGATASGRLRVAYQEGSGCRYDVRIPRDRDQVVPRCEKRIKARAGEVPLNLFVIFPVPCRISRLGRQGCRLWEILGSPSQERGEMG